MSFSKTSILIAILTLVSLGLLIFSQLYLRSSTAVPQVNEKLLEPITNNLDTKLIEELKRAQSFD